MLLFLWVTWAGALLTFVASTTVLSEQNECTIPLREQLQDLMLRISKLEKKLSGKSDYGEFVEKDGWVLVFRATSGLGSPVYDTWTRAGYHDDYKYTRATMPCGCTNISGSCDRHYRSRLMDSWPSAALDKVKLALYEDGVEKAYMVFTGLGSDYMNWFSAERLIESSWKDLKASTHNYFSINGDKNVRVNRRFYVSNSHHDCPGDRGWMSIKDNGNSCSWETSNQIPAFIYSRAQTMVNWEHSVDKMPRVVVDPTKVASLVYDDDSSDLDSMNEDEEDEKDEEDEEDEKDEEDEEVEEDEKDEEEDEYLPPSDDDNEDDNESIAGSQVGRADVMAVWIKFRSGVDLNQSCLP